VWPVSGQRGVDFLQEEPFLYTQSAMDDVRLELEETKRQIEIAREEGFERGLAEGRAKGREEAEIEMQGETVALETVATGILAERMKMVTEAGRDIVQLALSMAERITRRSLPVDEDAVLRGIREALAHVGETRRVMIRLNPREMDAIRERTSQLRELVPGGSHLEFRADPAITPGGCTLETPELHLDATIEGLLERFEEALLAWSDQQALTTGEAEEASDAA